MPSWDAALPLLVDLRGIRYLDSSAIHLLPCTRELHSRKQTPFAIVANPIVHRICGVLGLETRIAIFCDTAQAYDHFGAEARRR